MAPTLVVPAETGSGDVRSAGMPIRTHPLSPIALPKAFLRPTGLLQTNMAGWLAGWVLSNGHLSVPLCYGYSAIDTAPLAYTESVTAPTAKVVRTRIIPCRCSALANDLQAHLRTSQSLL